MNYFTYESPPFIGMTIIVRRLEGRSRVLATRSDKGENKCAELAGKRILDGLPR